MSYIPDVVEEWREIPGYEGLYDVSNLGRVRGRERKYKYRNEFRRMKGRILKPNLSMFGYEMVTLSNDRKRKTYLVHRLVAEVFLANPNKLPQVNHIDGKRTNNVVDNLEWCTAKENMVHSVENYIRTDLKPVDMCLITGEVVCTFPSIHSASNKTGIIRGNISRCCKGRYGYKTAGGYVWKFHDESVVI